MAKSEQQRQKKLAKKRAKELQARRQLAQTKQQMTSLSGQMQAASEGQVYGCYISSEVGNGMSTVLIARRASGGRLAIAFFLLDTYCLGVKDAGGRIGSPSDFAEMLQQMGRSQEMLAASPSTARKLADEAIEYAHSLGFAPHPDYRKVAPIWGDIDPNESHEEFTFGLNGKPYYMAGPHDDVQRQKWIFQRLRDSVGQGNFNFTLAMSPSMAGDLMIDDQTDADDSRVLRIEQLDD